MNKLIKGVKTLGTLVNRNSPVILTGTAIAGVFATTASGIKATPVAMDHIREAKERKEKETGDPNARLTPAETVQACAKDYIPTGLMAVGTALCMGLSTKISLKRNAALATCVVAGQNALSEYQNKVAEKFGEDKERSVHDDIARDRMLSEPASKNTIFKTGMGEHLCYDVYSGRYFYSDVEELRKAANDFNQRLLGDLYLSLNEWYELINLPCIGYGEDVGWNPNKGMLELHFGTQLADDGVTPCLTVDFRNGSGPYLGFNY